MTPGERGALNDEGLACSLDPYKAVTAAHLKTQEAKSTRLQIQNIVNAVVQNQGKGRAMYESEIGGLVVPEFCALTPVTEISFIMTGRP